MYATHHADVGYDAMDRYSYLVAPCIALLVRNHLSPSAEYKFPIPPEIRGLCDELVSAFKKLGSAHTTHTETIPEIPDTVADDDDEFIVTSGVGSDSLDEVLVTTSPLRSTHTPGETRSPPKYCPIVQPHLCKVLISMFTQVPSNGYSGSFFSVIMHYLMLSSIRANGQWIPSGRIMQTIAATTFCGRLTLYAHMIDGAEAGKSINYHECISIYHDYL